MAHSVSTGRSFYRGLLEALVQVMGSTKGYLLIHPPRVANLSRQLAHHLELGERATAELLFGSLLADLGMIGLAEDAWENPTPVLDAATRQRVERHPARSEAALLSIPHLETVAPLVRHHHEWWDGSGYPDGLAEEEIPMGARILRLADTVCALRAPRPHRASMDVDDVHRVVRASTGSEFDPRVADAFLHLAERGRLAPFHQRAYDRALRVAGEVLLPRHVPPLSSDQLLELMATLIDAKDPYTAGHSRRVAILSVAVARQLGLGDGVRKTAWAAGYLHDLGKVSVPLRVLTKPDRLSPEERQEVEGHSDRGATMLNRIRALRPLVPAIRYHHERWDGTGYPEGISGQHIPIVARILAVCDAYDAMTSRRAYRTSRTHEEAVEEVALCTGRHFCPRVAASFLALPDHLFEAVRRAPSARTDFFPPDRDAHRRHRRRTSGAA